jgi:hypothetical protein
VASYCIFSLFKGLFNSRILLLSYLVLSSLFHIPLFL